MKQPLDHNPFLAKAPAEARGSVEKRENIEWQTRAAPPTEVENQLGDALEQIFASGTESLPSIIQQLNAGGVLGPSGQPWTEASFQDYMKHLGR